MIKLNWRIPDQKSGKGYKDVKAEDIDFEVENDHWTDVKLADGTVIKMRINIIRVLKIDEHNPLTGEPLYHVESSGIIRTLVPHKLCVEPKDAAPTGEVPKGYG